MRSGMLRTYVQEDEVGAFALSRHSPLFGAELQGCLLGILLIRGQCKGPHLCRTRWMVLAERMANPCARHKDARQMRVAFEDNPEHVPHFTFVPVGGGEDVGNGWKGKAV